MSTLELRGIFELEHQRGDCVTRYRSENLITDAAKLNFLSSFFGNSPQPQPKNIPGSFPIYGPFILDRYIGLFSDGTISSSDTLLRHNWTEFVDYLTWNAIAAEYILVGRPGWTSLIAEGPFVINTNMTPIQINNSGSVAGVFVCASPGAVYDNGAAAAAAQLGYIDLWSVAPFFSPIAVAAGDLLKLQYSVSM